MKNPIPTLNKYIINRILGRLAGVSQTSFALVRHVGRRSGKPYETPIMVQPAKSGFIIALTYGPGTDWYRNVTAAGGCEILWQKRTYTVTAIEPVDTRTGRSAFSQPQRSILRLLGIQHFVRMAYTTPPE